MTDAQNTQFLQPEKRPESSSLPFLQDAPELLRVRILPAEFARLMNVSKQTVSVWIRKGFITLYADGRLDVTSAIQQLLRNTDPGRLRARFLKAAIADVSELRQTAAAADERISALEAALADINWRYTVDGEAAERFADLVRNNESALRSTTSTAAWRQMLDQFEAAAAAAALADWPDQADDLPDLDEMEAEAAAVLEPPESGLTREALPTDGGAGDE